MGVACIEEREESVATETKVTERTDGKESREDEKKENQIKELYRRVENGKKDTNELRKEGGREITERRK